MTISGTVANASGYTTAVSGTVVAATQTMQEAGFLGFVDENATRIGLAFTAATFCVFLISKAFDMWLKWLKHRANRNKKR